MNSVTPIRKGDPAPQEGMTISQAELDRLWPGDPAGARREIRKLLMAERERAPIQGPTPRPPGIAFATPKDEADLAAFCRYAWKENGYDFAPIDPDKVMLHVQLATREQGGVIGLARATDGTIAGAACLVPQQFWWSQQWFMQDLFIYVRPEHRALALASALADFCKWFCDEMSRTFGYRVYLMTGVQSMRRTREKVRFYKRHFNYVGGTFIYPLPEVKDG